MTAQAEELNGFDLEALATTVAAMEQQPEAGRVTFRGRTTWAGGPAGDGRTVDLEQAGGRSARGFAFRGDHPPALLGQDTGPTAGEVLLAALGSCLTATYASHATARGVPLDDLQVDVDGELDLNGFLRTSQINAGFQQIRADITVRSEAAEAVLVEIGEVASLASPVFDTVSRGVPVQLTVHHHDHATTIRGGAR